MDECSVLALLHMLATPMHFTSATTTTECTGLVLSASRATNTNDADQGHAIARPTSALGTGRRVRPTAVSTNRHPPRPLACMRDDVTLGIVSMRGEAHGSNGGTRAGAQRQASPSP